MTYTKHEFELVITEAPLVMSGVPEYIAQLMDKLIANAIEFSQENSPIVVSLLAKGRTAQLSVSNTGPALPENMSEQIFESMVSVRPQQVQDKPHLGLGLYIARLITDFHHGEITASNIVQDTQATGVTISITLPLSAA